MALSREAIAAICTQYDQSRKDVGPSKGNTSVLVEMQQGQPFVTVSQLKTCRYNPRLRGELTIPLLASNRLSNSVESRNETK